jgi:hypothetical protein
MWEEELANEKNRLEDDKENEQASSSEVPIDPEVEEEAFENYLFDRMMRHDGDAAHLLVHFRASLTVVPDTLSGERTDDPSLRGSRTAVLWEGL